MNFVIGESYKVISDRELFKKLQWSSGGYSELRMKILPGKIVTLRHISKNKFLVEYEGIEYVLHPDCLEYPSEVQLVDAIISGNVEKLFQLIDNDILNYQDKFGRTLIHIACSHGNTEIVRLLCEFGLTLDIPDAKGNFPIHSCVINKQYDILKFLMERFPDNLNKKTVHGKCPQDIALEIGDKLVATYFENKLLENETVSPKKFMKIFDSIPENEIPSTLNIDSIQENDTLSPPNNCLKENRISLSNNFLKGKGISLSNDFVKGNVISFSNDFGKGFSDNSPNINAKIICSLCGIREKNVALQDCGHTFCDICSDKLIICPVKNCIIKGRIRLFLG